ncbi:MAG: response regulator [Flavobacterium sp.]|nr:response regulator [Flavobacterium sp.]
MDSNQIPVNIFLADDDIDDRHFFSVALEEMLIESKLKLVPDGVALMQELNDGSKSIPDILFLDMNMPRKSGMDCLNEIRANSRFDRICIAIYSTFDTNEQIDKILAAGADVYFNKPHEMEKIKEMIKKVIQINKS